MKIEDLAPFLQNIDNRSLVDKVEMRMIEFFAKNELKPGDMIPKEVELAEAMNVSRTVIREAINRLKTMGLIDAKKHKGTVIKSPDLALVFQKSMIPWMMDERTLRDIFELRLVLEVGMADLVVSKISDADIAELEQLVAEEPNISREVRFEIDHEVAFHGKLYQITGNQTMIAFQQLLIPAFNHVYKSGLLDKDVHTVQFLSHKELVEILKKRDAAAFIQAMRQHLNSHYLRLWA